MVFVAMKLCPNLTGVDLPIDSPFLAASGLGRCVMVDAPSAFAGTWAVLKGVLNEVTTGKMLGLSLGGGETPFVG